MLAFLICTGVFFAFGGVVCVLALHKSPQSEAEARENAAIAASAASAKAKFDADLEARFRKECKAKPPAPIFPITNQDARERCIDMIQIGLKVPGSGDFPSDGAPELTTDDGCNRFYTSYFDATNPLGVKVRTHYKCTYDPRTSAVTIKTLD